MLFGLQPCRVTAVKAALVRKHIGEPAQVVVKALVLSQFTLNSQKLIGLAETLEPWPEVFTVGFGGKTWVIDGNHRVMVAYLRGDAFISAWHVDL